MTLSLKHTALSSLLIASAIVPSFAIGASSVTVISSGGTLQDAQNVAYFGPFEKSTSNRLIAGSFNGDLAKIKTMVDTKHTTWDVVELDGNSLARACDERLIIPLDWSKIPSKKDLMPEAVSDCGVGTLAWSAGIAYNADKLQGSPSSWADFWDLKKFPGKRGLRKSAVHTLEFALLADGVPKEKVYKVLSTPEGVDRAFAKLDEIKPSIQWWESGAQPQQWLAAGDVVMTSAYNGRIKDAQQEGTNLKFVWNQSLFDLDHWAVVRGTENLDASYEYLEFASKSENQQAFARTIAYGPTNVSALKGLTASELQDLPTAPANINLALATDNAFWLDHAEDLEVRFNAWASR